LSLPSTLLQDQGVLVTRPKHQAQNFIRMLQALGANAIGFPCIEICPIIQSDALNIVANKLDDYDIVIFISANAAENGAKLLENSVKSIKNAKIAAIGKSTKNALQQLGLVVDLSPEQSFTSEALLDLDTFSPEQISQQRILIIKGEGGRELLQDTLKSRGAQVELAEVYRRCVPRANIQPLHELWSKNRIQWITVTSNETLKNLYYMISEQGINEAGINEQGQAWLLQTSLVVPSQRCKQLAQQLGFNNQILVAQSATDEAMLDIIKQNARKQFNKL